MPYIPLEDRSKFEGVREYGYKSLSVGELNYVFTQIILGYLEEKGINYSNLNGVIGALDCCKLELYRQLVAPYEDIKEKKNGKVYFK